RLPGPRRSSLTVDPRGRYLSTSYCTLDGGDGDGGCRLPATRSLAIWRRWPFVRRKRSTATWRSGATRSGDDPHARGPDHPHELPPLLFASPRATPRPLARSPFLFGPLLPSGQSQVHVPRARR